MVEIKSVKELEEFNTLKSKYAFIPNKPITSPSEMLDGIDTETFEVDEIVLEVVNEHKEDAIFYGANEEFISKLERKLTSFGGELLCYDIDEYEKLVFEHGQLWYGDIVYFEKMKMGNCHDNIITLHEENPNLPIVAGYALSEYGHWFSHSWTLAKSEDGVNNYVVETTTPSVLYLGVILTESMRKDFIEKYKKSF